MHGNQACHKWLSIYLESLFFPHFKLCRKLRNSNTFFSIRVCIPSNLTTRSIETAPKMIYNLCKLANLILILFWRNANRRVFFISCLLFLFVAPLSFVYDFKMLSNVTEQRSNKKGKWTHKKSETNNIFKKRKQKTKLRNFIKQFRWWANLYIGYKRAEKSKNG